MQNTRPTRKSNLSSAAVVFIVGTLTTLGTTGCGSSAQNAQPAGSATAVSTSAPNAGAQASASGAATHPIDVCAVLPAATAAKLSGLAVTIGNTLSGGLQPLEYGCGYTNDADSVQFEVKVFAHDAATSYDFFFSASQKATPVRGVGDKAFFDNDGTMYVLKGNYLIQVNGVKTKDLCAAVARPVVAAL
jgi:hypothetical protein